MSVAIRSSDESDWQTLVVAEIEADWAIAQGMAVRTNDGCVRIVPFEELRRRVYDQMIASGFMERLKSGEDLYPPGWEKAYATSTARTQ